MNKSDSIKELAIALNKAQAEFSPAPMNSTNPHLRNKYADLGSIIESTKPVLAKHGLSVSQMVSGVANEIGITTLLMHVSGEWLESSVLMPIIEQKGINNAQVAGSIVSYLRRYSLAAALGVYSGDDDDAGSIVKDKTQKPARPEVEPAKELPEPKAKNGKLRAVYMPADLRLSLQKSADKRAGEGLGNYNAGILASNMELCFSGEPDSDHKRHVVLSYLFGVESTKDLTNGQILAAKNWLNVKPNESGEWMPEALAMQEARACYHQALRDEGQAELPL